jgi:hypothetical protein
VRAAAQLAPGATDLLPVVQRAFETIAFGKTSTSAADAQRIGYLRPVDGVTMNRERLIADAKARALVRVSEGYHAPSPKPVPVGGDAVRAALEARHAKLVAVSVALPEAVVVQLPARARREKRRDASAAAERAARKALAHSLASTCLKRGRGARERPSPDSSSSRNKPT